MIKSIGISLLAVLSIFAPIKAMFIAIGVLVFSDLILGVMAARKRKEPITSAGLRRSLSKLFVFEVALLLAFIIERFLLDGSFPVVKILCNLIGLIELKSIMENLNSISGRDLLKDLISKLGSENDKTPKDKDNGGGE